MPEYDKKVDSLEKIAQLLKQFIFQTNSALARVEAGMEALKEEMKTFKQETRELFMKGTPEDRRTWQRKASVIDEREKRRDGNKELVERSKELDIVDENILLPALPPLLRQYFAREPYMSYGNFRRWINGESYNVANFFVCEDMAFVLETGHSPDAGGVMSFLEQMEDFSRFFPDYADKEIILIFGAPDVDSDTVSFATEKGVYVMAFRDWDYMDILNFDDIKKAAHQ